MCKILCSIYSFRIISRVGNWKIIINQILQIKGLSMKFYTELIKFY